MTPRRKKLLLLGFTMAAIIAATIFLTRSTEPRYGGHSLSYWVMIYVEKHNDDAATKQADDAVRQIGTKAIPFLVQWIAEEPHGTNILTAIRWPIDWLRRTLNPDANWSAQDKLSFRPDAACRAFEVLSHQAIIPTPALVRILNHSRSEETAIRAAFALASLGKAGLLPLTEALTNSNPTVRTAAATGFWQLGANAKMSIPILIQTLDDKNERVRWAAFESLRILQPDSSLVIPAMIAHLASEKPTERIWAAIVLSPYESLAKPAVPALLRALEKAKTSTDYSERGMISGAIRRIDPEALTNATQSLTNAPPR